MGKLYFYIKSPLILIIYSYLRNALQYLGSLTFLCHCDHIRLMLSLELYIHVYNVTILPVCIIVPTELNTHWKNTHPGTVKQCSRRSQPTGHWSLMSVLEVLRRSYNTRAHGVSIYRRYRLRRLSSPADNVRKSWLVKRMQASENKVVWLHILIYMLYFRNTPNAYMCVYIWIYIILN